MSNHGVIMERLIVKNDHINADSWGHGERRKAIMEKRMTIDKMWLPGLHDVAMWIIYNVVLYEIFMYADINPSPILKPQGCAIFTRGVNYVVIMDDDILELIMPVGDDA